MTSPVKMPTTLNDDADRTALIEFFAQPTYQDDTSSNSKIFRLDIPLDETHDNLFTPPNTLIRHGAILTFITNNDVTSLFANFDSGTSEYQAIAQFLKITGTKFTSCLKPGKIEEILLILSCLYLLVRLKLPKDSSSVTAKRLLSRLVTIPKPDEHPISLSLVAHYSRLRELNTKKFPLNWTEPARKVYFGCLARAMTSYTSEFDTYTWLWALVKILNTATTKPKPFFTLVSMTQTADNTPNLPDAPISNTTQPQSFENKTPSPKPAPKNKRHSQTSTYSRTNLLGEVHDLLTSNPAVLHTSTLQPLLNSMVAYISHLNTKIDTLTTTTIPSGRSHINTVLPKHPHQISLPSPQMDVPKVTQNDTQSLLPTKVIPDPETAQTPEVPPQEIPPPEPDAP